MAEPPNSAIPSGGATSHAALVQALHDALGPRDTTSHGDILAAVAALGARLDGTVARADERHALTRELVSTRFDGLERGLTEVRASVALNAGRLDHLEGVLDHSAGRAEGRAQVLGVLGGLLGPVARQWRGVLMGLALAFGVALWPTPAPEPVQPAHRAPIASEGAGGLHSQPLASLLRD